MRLNTLSPGVGAKTSPKRVGRGIGSGLGKTCGRGHKGQKARKSGPVPAGFEGGQMPLHRRLPKFGFITQKGQLTAHVRLNELNKVEGNIVNLDTLKAANIISKKHNRARIFLSGSLNKAVTVQGLAVSQGARAALEAVGGQVEA